MKLIRFMNRWRKWQPGDVAGFDDLEADRIIGADAGVTIDPRLKARPRDGDKQMTAEVKPRRTRRGGYLTK